jgi:hypothetical protein
MTTECPRCEGFGHVPENSGPGWYRREWRILLDPTVSWHPCPDCQRERSPLATLHERLSQVLILRLEGSVPDWVEHGDWRHGVTADGQEVWRWRDVLCLPPGPETDHQGWLLVSSLGVRRLGARDECEELLRRLGAPLLPA